MWLDSKKILQYLLYFGLAVPLCLLAWAAAEALIRLVRGRDELADALHRNGELIQEQHELLQNLIDLKTGGKTDAQ